MKNSKKIPNSKFQIPKVIILMGPPGSGKGTQAELLAERLNLFHLETSKILEEKFKEKTKGEILIEGKKYSFSKEKKLWEEGKLCSPPFVTYLIIKKIEELKKARKNLILSGSPRTLYEAEKVIPVLEKLYGKKNIICFFLEISPEETIFRNSHRRICELMRHPILYLKENAKLKRCPLDGSRLIKRGRLDKLETIKVRLKEYKERTLPVIDYLKKRKIKVKRINGSPPPAIVFENILKKLK
jgi:adenylate kinase